MCLSSSNENENKEKKLYLIIAEKRAFRFISEYQKQKQKARKAKKAKEVRAVPLSLCYFFTSYIIQLNATGFKLVVYL